MQLLYRILTQQLCSCSTLYNLLQKVVSTFFKLTNSVSKRNLRVKNLTLFLIIYITLNTYIYKSKKNKQILK